MKNNEWYLNKDWNAETKEFFEAKLKKVRDPYNKAQYLRIKGNRLLKTNSKIKQEVGVGLLNRVLDNFIDEETQAYSAAEILGDYYRLDKEISLSEKYYRKVIIYYQRSRSGTSGIADIKLAEMIVDSKQKDKYDEMYLLLTEVFESTKGKLIFNDNKFRYALVLCKITHSIDKKDEAIYYAKKAFEIANITEPQLNTKPIGIPKPNNEDLEFLKMVKNGRASQSKTR